jgi:LacI family transcriptional regulator
MTTIRDVARKLNLSITTVSRALDGYDDVAETTRQRVAAAAAEMGYTPNRAARQLRRQRAETIGYILPGRTPQFSDPYFSEFVAGLGDETSQRNNDLLVSSAVPDSLEEQAIYRRWVQGGKVDGIIVNRVCLHDWRVQFLASQKMPFVCLERPRDNVDFVGIETDPISGFVELVAHIAGLNHTRIAYIGGPPRLKIAHDRFVGFLAGLRAAGLELDPDLVFPGDLTAESGYQATGCLLDLGQPPSAIVCVNDTTAMGAMHAAHDRGLQVGRDIAISGYDGTADSAHTQPPLTTLDLPLYDVARELVSILLACIDGTPPPPRQDKIRPKLIIRASTCNK